ncbi:MAG TPA: DUF4276 family protein [Candidatus Bipolaricaulis sp.]|nr:DUF4276 family protein [Candidatus Bipolaricaulis sp.]HPD07552.1 DUF4276 family protein [Candidatus Bipolaricaulis sp.]
MPAVIQAAVEGRTDAAIARKLIAHVGAEPGWVHGEQGKSHLKQYITGYNHAARHAPWLVLVDLDRDADCAPPLRQAWLAQPAPLLCLRVAVRETEAWLLADAEMLSRFLRVAQRKVPPDPESLPDPKQAIVNLTRASTCKDIRQDMVPREGSGRTVGPAYSTRLIEFVQDLWRPDIAANRADSLARAIRCLRRLMEASA